ncbi:related to Rpc19 - DNA-directed RNA polymerases I and III, 18KD subunit [Pseudozyma flocculosa]|uniref:Related to Rpc19 - DNA-directed RNA polymerases I and III, 18KD subunit n=1 Tax=Pseudozyma flocculosa TaxID=84751 RepID=A0A5C3ESV7_9BASI|nr:related to Rpc19 - DNA-directed RNA polymerases I and III, 18KD subunit [Pseudozyma flocculosa]
MSNPNLAEVMNNGGPATVSDKITLLPGYEPDLSAATFCLKEEDHTLGNSLSARVEFCGYSVPHPSEAKIHLRVQMYDNASAMDAVRDALDNLDRLFETIGQAYEANLEAGNYERFTEPQLDHAALEKMAKVGKERRAKEEAEKAAARRAAAADAAGRPM